MISVKNISKMYPLYKDPRDRLKQSLWYATPRFLRRKQAPIFFREFWALKNISFDVQQGESIGIVGRNGSGKSTLLQIMAGTLTPTLGEVHVQGQVSALLELSTGFNPEFSGRENIFMNGIIRGLSQTKIDELYDNIVAFADIGDFINQPIKLYSSGMAVRLAFAVQTFVPKDILIVDEALSVGDVAFQRKCMASMERFRDNGGTFILVSHNTQSIVQHCERCLLMVEGELLADGPAKMITDLYEKIMFSPPADARQLILNIKQTGWKHISSQSSLNPIANSDNQAENGLAKLMPDKMPLTNYSSQQNSDLQDYFDPNLPQLDTMVYGNGAAKITDYFIKNMQDEKVNVLISGRYYRWIYRVQFFENKQDIHFGLLIKTKDGITLSPLTNKQLKTTVSFIPADMEIEVSFQLKLNLVSGVYFFNLGLATMENEELNYLHRLVDAGMIRVISPDSRQLTGLVYVEPEFDYKFIEPASTI
ncbi:MAG: ABC transporter ATP-binding protein [Anaerolineae bacterium]|nr:ABC transporter ATP-binding protein [Anaerolineae bacterium]